MKTCTEHRIQWSDGYPGCPFCLAKEIAQLKKAVTRCQGVSNEDLKRRRKAEWDFAKLAAVEQDGAQIDPPEDCIENASYEIDAALRRGDLMNGAANDIRKALGLETKA